MRPSLPVLTTLVGLLVIVSACQWFKTANDAQAGDRDAGGLVARIDAKPVRAISPYIFGFGSGIEKDRAEVWRQRPTIYRFGGNASERFNWKTNAYNSNADWFFTNLTLGFPSAVDTFLAANQAKGVASAVTLPLLGWVAKDGTSASFPTSAFPNQQQLEPNGRPYGNGLDSSGKRLAADPATTSVQSDAAFLTEWVIHLKTKFGTFPHFYILGNEPMLWGDTHRDVHPSPTTYDEYLEKYLAAAIAVRKADPAAVLIGPAEWGWLSVHYSQFDNAGAWSNHIQGTDRKKHGGQPFLEWFLSQVKKKEDELGLSLLDVLDYHYYPSDLSLYKEEGLDQANRKLRLEATRSLWDPTYKEGGWINDTIEFIPLLKRIVAKTKPSLKIAIGEYNFHGEKDISGAIALAEVLRIFVEQDVHMAEYWIDPPADTPVAAAFRLYRNYDDAGAAFGDQYVANDFGDKGDLAVVSSKSETDRKVTVIVLNKSLDLTRTLTLAVEGVGSMKATTQYQLTSKDPKTLAKRALPTSKEARLALPPLSATLVEFKY